MIIAKAREDFSKLELQQVKGDGNCFYRAVGYLGIGEEFHEEMRDDVKVEVETHHERYVEYFEGGLEGLRAWVQEHGNPGVWADGISCKAAANCIFRPIVVIRPHVPEQPPSVFIPEIKGGEKRPPAYLEFTEERNAEHYNPYVLSGGGIMTAFAERLSGIDGDEIEAAFNGESAFKSPSCLKREPPDCSPEAPKATRRRLRRKFHPSFLYKIATCGDESPALVEVAESHDRKSRSCIKN